RDLFNSRYYFVQNPLAIHVWHEAQTTNDEEAARSGFVPHGNGTISIGRKELAFTHFQSSFYRHARAYLACRGLFIPRSLSRTILETDTLYALMAKLSAVRFGHGRATVMRELLHDNWRLADL